MAKQPKNKIAPLREPAKTASARVRAPQSINLTDLPRHFEGRWCITHMPDFDQETIDEEVPAFTEFDKKGGGGFQFILVQGDIDARYALMDGRPYIAFTWAGNDECDEATGRGEGLMVDDRTIHGTFYIHKGDAYAFVAERKPGRSK